MASRTRLTFLVLAVGAIVLIVTGLWGRVSPIRPLEQLPGGISAGPSIEDVSATSAVIALQTGAPAMCQVNYGPTMAYGQMRRMSMSGAMSNHRVLLPGLQPDAVYHVRFTAVDAQARLYQSGDLAFRTQPSPAGSARGQNVAALSAGARVVGVSSNYGGGDNAGTYGAEKAIDGDSGTEWSSDDDGDKAWIEIELARSTRLASVGFWTRTMGTSAEVKQLEVVIDGKTTLGPFRLPGATGMHYFPVQVTARRLRFNVVKSTGGNTGAVEIEAIAVP